MDGEEGRRERRMGREVDGGRLTVSKHVLLAACQAGDLGDKVFGQEIGTLFCPLLWLRSF